MSAALRKNESPLHGTRRLLFEQIDAALDSVRRGKNPSDESIHESRKQLKSARASLRLLRPYLGKVRYRRENRALRDAGQTLRAVRDAKMQIQTLQELTRRDEKGITTAYAATLRRPLLRERNTTRQALTPAALNRYRRALIASRQRLQAWSPRQSDPSGLGKSLRRVYKNGRACYLRARHHADDEQLHELRKQTKYLENQLKGLQTLKPRYIGKLAKQAHTVGGLLGDDHDLAVMQNNVRRQDALQHATGSQAFSQLLHRRRKRLQIKAFHAAKRLYASKPRALAKIFKNTR